MSKKKKKTDKKIKKVTKKGLTAFQWRGK